MKPDRLPLLPGLDGLRAFSVVAVLVYHAHASWLPAGFLGVEFFFVISGFLITAQLLIEWRRSGTISLGHFYQRRARRLLPAVFVLLFAVLAGSLLFFPDEVVEAREGALASLAYVTNWYLIFDHQPYFESFGRPPLLQHLWSLAVEEQFYVFWPIVLTLALKVMRPAFVLPCVIVLAVWSSLLMIGLNERGVDPDRLYYGTDTRAAGLLIGSALAFFWTPWLRSAGSGFWASARLRSLDVLGVGAAVFLVFLSFTLHESHPLLYAGGFAVTSLTSAVLIAVVVHPRTLIGRALGLQPLRWIGVRAYSLYLWHWPVFMLTRPHVDVPLDGPVLVALQMAITLVLADISFRFIETPIRNGLLGRLRGRLARLPHRPAWQQGTAVTGTAVIAAGLIAFSATVAGARAPEAPDFLNVQQISGIVTGTPGAATAAAPPALTRGTATPETTPGATSTPAGLRAPSSGIEGEPSTIEATPGATAAGTPPPMVAATEAPDPNSTPFQSSVSSSSSSSSPVPGAPTAPPRDPAAGGVRATAVGDSVMLGAAGELANVLGSVDVDAAVGRQMNALIEILQARKDQGLLADIVLVQVGNNGPITAEQFDQMMGILADVPQVLVMNVRVPLPWEGANNEVIAAGARRYPNATFLDWHATSEGRGDLFWTDNVHLRPEGASVYVGLIVSNIK